MAWHVFEPIECEYRGVAHRFLELEADSDSEYAELLERTLAKGWSLYASGARPEAMGVKVAIFCKPLVQ